MYMKINKHFIIEESIVAPKKMTDEELEEEAIDLAGEAWQMVLRGYVENPPKTFEEMVESMKAYLKEKSPPESTNS